MRNRLQQFKNTLSAGKNQQLILPIGIAFKISQEAPVRKLWEVLEGMDFTTLENEDCHTGRKSAASVQELTAIVIFGAMNSIFSSRKLESACENDIRFMWLLDGRKAPDHSVLSRFRKDTLPLVLKQIFPALMAYLYEQGEIDYATTFIDGTKLEANANRYSFVWKKSIEKHLARLKEKAALLLESMKIEQLASIETLRSLAAQQRKEMHTLGIQIVSGSGRRKSTQQKAAEELEQLACKWDEYEKHLSIMGKDRNSYSKTDPDATFMRMKDDHMRNGQLKAGYNVQLATNSEYIVGYDVFQDRNDSGTLLPFLSTLQAVHGRKFKSVTADAGYESHENYAALEQAQQLSFIKPLNYETQKRKNKQWVGRFEDMHYDEASDTFVCQNGKSLHFSGRSTRKSKTGYQSAISLYTCTKCTGCPLRSKCSKAKDESTKTLSLCWEFERLRAVSLANISSDKGILYRINRSIQAEGTFGVIKQDWGFRRFLLRGKQNILTEIGILAFAFNMNKLCAKIQQNRTGTQLFQVNIA